jgi:oligopeptide transport system permease protein
MATAPERSAPTLSLEDAEKGSSLGRDAWKRLRKNRAAVASGVILVVMVFACLLVPWLSTTATIRPI